MIRPALNSAFHQQNLAEIGERKCLNENGVSIRFPLLTLPCARYSAKLKEKTEMDLDSDFRVESGI